VFLASILACCLQLSFELLRLLEASVGRYLFERGGHSDNVLYRLCSMIAGPRFLLVMQMINRLSFFREQRQVVCSLVRFEDDDFLLVFRSIMLLNSLMRSSTSLGARGA